MFGMGMINIFFGAANIAFMLHGFSVGNVGIACVNLFAGCFALLVGVWLCSTSEK